MNEVKFKGTQGWDLTKGMKSDTNLTFSLLHNSSSESTFLVQLHLLKNYLYLSDHYQTETGLKFAVLPGSWKKLPLL